jgi:hypothetical protein
MPIDTTPEGIGIEEAVVKHLRADTAVAALIGDRLFPGIADAKAAYPYLTYQVISDVDDKTLEGGAGNADATIQLKCWGQAGKQGRRQARQLYRAIRDALHGFGPGMMAGVTWVHEAWITGRSDEDDSPDGGRSDGDACVMAELSIGYEDTVPTF